MALVEVILHLIILHPQAAAEVVIILTPAAQAGQAVVADRLMVRPSGPVAQVTPRQQAQVKEIMVVPVITAAAEMAQVVAVAQVQ